jgi:hypothetical protein
MLIELGEAAQRQALAADKGRVQKTPESRKKLKARKMPVNRADSPPSAARCVSPLVNGCAITIFSDFRLSRNHFSQISI